MECTDQAELNSPTWTEEQCQELKARIEQELETLESIYVDEGVVQQAPRVVQITKIRAKDQQALEEQAEAQAEIMNAKIMEAAEHQHIAIAAACRLPKAKAKAAKKP